jgi:hypothetical protein
MIAGERELEKTWKKEKRLLGVGGGGDQGVEGCGGSGTDRETLNKKEVLCQSFIGR